MIRNKLFVLLSMIVILCLLLFNSCGNEKDKVESTKFLAFSEDTGVRKNLTDFTVTDTAPSPSLASPNDNWDVVIKDKWAEKFYLNKIYEDFYGIHYEGKWVWRSPINRQTQGDAAATFIKSDSPGFVQGALTLLGRYGDGDVGYYIVYPYVAKYDNTKVYRWYGTKHWLRDTQFRENIYMDVIQGQIHWFTNVW